MSISPPAIGPLTAKATMTEIVRSILRVSYRLQRSYSMAEIVKAAGGWSANQRMNELIRAGDIGFVVRCFPRSHRMMVRMYRTDPLRCPHCGKYTHGQYYPWIIRPSDAARPVFCASKHFMSSTECHALLGYIRDGKFVRARRIDTDAKHIPIHRIHKKSSRQSNKNSSR